MSIKKKLQRLRINFIGYNRLNLLKTFLINLRYLPLSQAVKFPIFVIGPCKFDWRHSQGKIILRGSITSGMLTIGEADLIRSYGSNSVLVINGTLIVDTKLTLRRGIRINLHKGGTLQFGPHIVIGDNVTIVCWDKISIGHSTRVAYNCTIMDTDIHYMVNTKTREIHDNHRPIEIGENNWIGPYCAIKKGTRTPKGTILIGPYSTTSKDYTSVIPEFSMLAGNPAKLIREGFRRVENVVSEKTVMNHFMISNQPYMVDPNVNLDDFCQS